jgi:hypothetical protein
MDVILDDFEVGFERIVNGICGVLFILLRFDGFLWECF